MTKIALSIAAASLALVGTASANEAFYAVGPRAPTEWVGVNLPQTSPSVSTTGSIRPSEDQGFAVERRSDARRTLPQR
jgi:hypothetical protein